MGLVFNDDCYVVACMMAMGFFKSEKVHFDSVCAFCTLGCVLGTPTLGVALSMSVVFSTLGVVQASAKIFLTYLIYFGVNVLSQWNHFHWLVL